ncbi:hypothetical protein [Jonesia quinghaiensis]|uniref:hypothetical protein n=1 Tax=Jonesia quinghaiensis TaxID=262806 RepID=UPI00041E6425|nr:hypothetical protein [Jonesia quinghaiensis]
MSTPLQREGSHLDELMRNIYTEYGDVTVSNVERVRTGGVGGFFAKEVFRVSFITNGSPRSTTTPVGAASAPVATRSPGSGEIIAPSSASGQHFRHASAASAAVPQGLESLLAAAEEGDEVMTAAQSPQFTAVMESLHHAVGAPKPAGRVLPETDSFVPFTAQPTSNAPTAGQPVAGQLGSGEYPTAFGRGASVQPTTAVPPTRDARIGGMASDIPSAIPLQPVPGAGIGNIPDTLGGRPPVTQLASLLSTEDFLRIGVPQVHVAAAMAAVGGHVLRISDVLSTVPRASHPPYESDAILAVVGPSRQCIAVAQELARDLGLDDKSIATAGRHDAVVRFGPLVLTTKSARDLRAAAREQEHPVVVAVGIGDDATDWHRAQAILEAFDPDYTYATVLADQEISGTKRWVNHVRQAVSLDALQVWNMRNAATPGAVLHLGIPVARIDGFVADSVVWGATLSQALTPSLWD